MGHLSRNSVYTKLGEKIDGFSYRAPFNDKLYAILKELYSENEAYVTIKMPYFFSDFDRIAKITKYEKTKLRNILDRLVAKGLVMDLFVNGSNYYSVSPVLIGIFEYTMMRRVDELDSKKWAGLFHDYLSSDDTFYEKNFGNSQKFGIARALPYIDAIKEEDHVNILDYEKAEELIDGIDKFALELCSCRHEKHHAGTKLCDIPLESCTSFGIFADSLIRNNFAKEISKTQMKEKLAQSKERGLVMSCDNVQKRPLFLCHCCGCCCNILLGVNKYGYPNTIVTSNYIAETDENLCNSCKKCQKACQVNAIEMVQKKGSTSEKQVVPQVDQSFCIGCGLCVLKCEQKAITLAYRGERVLTPETTFERLILQHVEAGTLANQLFDNPQSITQKFLRGFIGAFVNLEPVKKALVSDALRSTFLSTVETGLNFLKRDWVTKL